MRKGKKYEPYYRGLFVNEYELSVCDIKVNEIFRAVNI
jgi:hypothetical protein